MQPLPWLLSPLLPRLPVLRPLLPPLPVLRPLLPPLPVPCPLLPRPARTGCAVAVSAPRAVSATRAHGRTFAAVPRLLPLPLLPFLALLSLLCPPPRRPPPALTPAPGHLLALRVARRTSSLPLSFLGVSTRLVLAPCGGSSPPAGLGSGPRSFVPPRPLSLPLCSARCVAGPARRRSWPATACPRTCSPLAPPCSAPPPPPAAGRRTKPAPASTRSSPRSGASPGRSPGGSVSPLLLLPLPRLPRPRPAPTAPPSSRRSPLLLLPLPRLPRPRPAPTAPPSSRRSLWGVPSLPLLPLLPWPQTPLAWTLALPPRPRSPRPRPSMSCSPAPRSRPVSAPGRSWWMLPPGPPNARLAHSARRCCHLPARWSRNLWPVAPALVLAPGLRRCALLCPAGAGGMAIPPRTGTSS